MFFHINVGLMGWGGSCLEICPMFHRSSF